MKKSIGIIGGAGPMSGLLLFQFIIEICQKKYNCHNDEDFPLILLLNFPFSDMLKTPKESIIAQELQNSFAKLQGVEIIGIACNTLHNFLPKVKDKRLIDMPKETDKHISKKETLILCTTTSKKKKAYSDSIYLNEKDQNTVDEIIDRILKGNITKEDSNFLEKIIETNIKTNPKIESIILGCTELSLINHKHKINSEKKIIDPLFILANKLCSLCYQK